MLILLHGNEDFLIQTQINNIIIQYQLQMQQPVYLNLQEVPVDVLFAEVCTNDLFATRKLIICNNFDSVAVKSYFEQVSPTFFEQLQQADNILVCKYQRDDAILKTFSQAIPGFFAVAQVIDVKSKNEAACIQWVKSQLQSKPCKVSEQTLQQFVRQFHYNLSLLNKELQRIFLEKEGGAVITDADFVSSADFLEESVFTLLDAIDARNPTLTMTTLRNVFVHQTNHFGFLTLLLKNFKEMYQISLLQSYQFPSSKIAERLNMHAYRAKILQQKSASLALTQEQYQTILQEIIATELALKSGKSTAERAIETLVLLILFQTRKQS